MQNGEFLCVQKCTSFYGVNLFLNLAVRDDNGEVVVVSAQTTFKNLHTRLHQRL